MVKLLQVILVIGALFVGVVLANSNPLIAQDDEAPEVVDSEVNENFGSEDQSVNDDFSDEPSDELPPDQDFGGGTSSGSGDMDSGAIDLDPDMSIQIEGEDAEAPPGDEEALPESIGESDPADLQSTPSTTEDVPKPANEQKSENAEDDSTDSKELTKGGVERQYVFSRKGQVFGRKRVRLSIGKTKFDADSGQDEYETFYGNPKNMPEIQADYFFFDWYLTLGVSFSAGLYQADGHAVKLNESGAITKDLNAPTSLTFVPFQFAIIGQLSPLPWKWIVFDYWMGREFAYFQEVRNETSDLSAMITLAETEDEPDQLTNKGYKNASIVGMSVNINLTGLDSGGVNSMRGPMGIGAVYLTGFMENVFDQSEGNVSFERSMVGIGFTFESVN